MYKVISCCFKEIKNIYINYEDAKKSIFEYIEVFFNSKRLHSSLGYKTPNEIEFKALNVA
ncbi:TPA: IS3 family transposase [Clostridium perfringens]|nr:IS3 family transposase [Clostridium perfringens]HAT4262577.1 IS3 family transposase [Clostridium perfringens]